MFAPIVAAATLALGVASTPDPYIPLMRDRLVAESPIIRAIGVNPRDFVFRLDYLTGHIEALSSSASDAERDDLRQQTKLELKLDAELLVNLCPVFGAIAGLDESFYNADPKVPPDPVAFYVPRPDARKPYGVVVLLHGRAQTETDLLSHAIFRQLADRSHAILIAPWGTGAALWSDPGALEVVRIVDEVERSFPVDDRHVFIGGVSLGGAGAFYVAARYPSRFRGVLNIGGGLRPQDAFLVGTALRDRDVYLLGPPQDAYEALAAACIPASQYTVDEHADFYTIGGTLEQAWNDMFDGTVRNNNTRDCS